MDMAIGPGPGHRRRCSKDGLRHSGADGVRDLHLAGPPVSSGCHRRLVDRPGGGGLDGPSAVLCCSLAAPEAAATMVVSISGGASSHASNCFCSAPPAATFVQSRMRPARSAARVCGRCGWRLRRCLAWLWVAPVRVVWMVLDGLARISVAAVGPQIFPTRVWWRTMMASRLFAAASRGSEG